MITPPQHVISHMSCVTCPVSHVMCHVSHVMCHISHFFSFLLNKVVKLIGGGSVIYGAYPVKFSSELCPTNSLHEPFHLAMMKHEAGNY